MSEQYEDLSTDEALAADDTPEVDADLRLASQDTSGDNIKDGTSNT
jgi:hypothetical protein